MLFDWPLRQRQPLDYSYYGLSFFVDHNPAVGAVLNYYGGAPTLGNDQRINLAVGATFYTMRAGD